MYVNILQYLEASAARLPDKPAYVSETDSMTYSRLVSTSKAVGTKIAGLLPSREAVAVFMGREVTTMAALMGIMYAGCISAPLDPDMPAERVLKVFVSLKPGCIIADSSAAKLLAELDAPCPVLTYEEAAACAIDQALLDARREAAKPTDPVQLFYLSDASGVPRGIAHTHRSVINYSRHTCALHGVDENQNFGNQAPFFYSNIMWDMYPVIYTGATCYLTPRECFVLPGYFMDYFSKNKISTVTMVPSSFNYIADSGVLTPNSLPDLLSVYMVGEVIPYEKMRKWREAAPKANVLNFYASTESPYVAEFILGDRVFQPGELVPAGKPFDGVKLLLLDENGDQCAQGETGEMFISSPWLSSGYYNDPERTKKSFIQNPLESRWMETVYRTGDLGRFNEKGELYFMGRRDSQIKHKGYRLDLGEIEAALETIEGWQTGCCVFDDANDKIYCFYTGKLTDKEIKSALSKLVDKYMLPDVLVCREALPVTSGGHIDRVKLKKEI